MKKSALTVILMIAFYSIGQSQDLININSGVVVKYEESSGSKSSDLTLKDSKRFRSIILNPVLQSSDNVNVQDTILLDLFSDRKYKAVIEKISKDLNGTLMIRSKLVGFKYSYCLISTYEGKSLMILEIPENDEYYKLKFDHRRNNHYLLEIDRSKEKYLEGAPSVIPPVDDKDSDVLKKNDQERISNETIQGLIERNLSISGTNVTLNDENSQDTITLLIVYTPAAAVWASSNESGIANTISSLMAKADLALNNSNTLLTIELVHSAQVSYTELNNVDDLYNLRGTSDGLMDNVHNLRDYYAADLVVLLEDISYTGGQGYLLSSTAGQPAYGFSLTRVQQASWTYTTIHEIGHNLGCHHHKLQNTQPGPGIFSYSAGWRWTDPDGGYYCSIMTYEGGSNFDDGITHTRVPHFSDPAILYLGELTGNVADGNNARTIRETKSVVSSYRTEQPSVRVLSPNGGEKWLVGSTQTIHWTVSSKIEYCLLYYSVNGGYSFTPIGSVSSEINSYEWTVPDTPSTQCRIEVIGIDVPQTFSTYDLSDYNFEIVTEIIDPCSEITVIGGCGSGYAQSFTGGGSGLWFSGSPNACGYTSPGTENIYSFVAPVTGMYSLQVTAASGYVDYLWKTGSCSSSGWNCLADVNSAGQHGSVSWTQGTTYLILLDDENSTAGTHTFYINCPDSPVKTLGNTEVYGLTSTTANRRAQTIIFTEAGTIQSISIYHNGGTGQVLLGVYSDEAGVPGARLGITSATTISSAAGWQTLSLTSPVTVSSGQKVWLAWVFENNPGIRYITGTPARAQSAKLWTGGMPDPFGSSSLANYRYSVYCTYIPGGTETKTNGITEVLGSTSTTANRRAQTITFTEGGTIQNISIYHNGGTGQVFLGIYADASGVPGARLGVTPATTISSSAGWQTVSLMNPVSITTEQKVWLSWVFENNPGIRYETGTPARAQSGALWTGGMPDPFGSSSLANYRYSIYCTYIPGGTETKTNGITEVYSLSSTTANRRAQTITFTEAGTIQGISIYHNGGTGRVLLGVYEDVSGVPGARLGVTSATTISTSKGWQTIPLTNPYSVSTGQKVWLSWVFENNPGIRYTTGTPARAQSVALWPGGMPDNFGSSSFANYRYSIYCTYTTEAGDEVKFVNEPVEASRSDRDEEEVLIYPNPAGDHITVKWNNKYDSRLTLSIFDLQGRPLKTIRIEPDVNEVYVEMDNLKYGIYLLELKVSKSNVVINRSRIVKY